MTSNVIAVDFGNPLQRALSELTVSFNCEILYVDTFIALSRLTWRFGEKVYVQHVMTEVRV